jgi:DNA-directed RNA polymerase beta subunit
MAEALEKLRNRTDFSKIKTAIPIPNLIEVQKRSYERFLQMNTAPADRFDQIGLQAVFKSIFPIKDFRETCSLEFVEYTIGNWECKCGELQGIEHLRSDCAYCGGRGSSSQRRIRGSPEPPSWATSGPRCSRPARGEGLPSWCRATFVGPRRR